MKTFDWLGGVFAAMGLALGGAILAAGALVTFVCGLALEVVAVIATAAYPIAGKIADGLARASELIVNSSRNLLTEVRRPPHMLGAETDQDDGHNVHNINGSSRGRRV